MTDLAVLTREEQIALDDGEERIGRGLKTFIEVGSALAAVRDNRLYRADFETFEAYCNERWGFTRIRAHQLASAADLALTMVNSGLQEPDNERQVRELAKLRAHDDERRAYAAEIAHWERTEQLLKSGETVEAAILRSQAVAA